MDFCFFKRSVTVIPLWVQGAPSGWPVCPVHPSSSFFLLAQQGIPGSSCFFMPQPSNQPSRSGVPILLSPEWYLEPKVWVVRALTAPGLLLTPGPLRGGCCLVSQSCLTLCDSMDCSPPGSSVHGISQTRTWTEPASPVLAGGFFTPEPPGKLLLFCPTSKWWVPKALPLFSPV